ncbi:hypothetical protein B6D60_05030 [candidate division KSB1 bacterium 4484_87]|nr:MAG: hypothetical protein B6D60_05030 [candidate division KSB1 bacterium 4484_87]
MLKFIRKYFWLSFLGIFIFGSLLFAEERPQVDLIRIQGGTVNPISAEFIIESIEKAENNKSECIIIQLDTPGGLITATQDIVKKELGANVPVIVFVYPSGSGAVSAGTSITIAAHFAVMAPGTNIGAAHPVGAGKTDTSDVGVQKATNWWATFNRSVAEKRGRNADWLEKAVRESESITEREALEKNVIDFVAKNIDDLLEKLDGKEAKLDTGSVILHTKNAIVNEYRANLRFKILDLISNPSTAYILLMLGLLGMYFELSNPGAILPGVLGGISLILAFFAMQQLPINVAGILLIIFGTILFVLELKITSYGVLTIGGIISMLLGSLMLFRSTPSIGVHLPTSLVFSVTFVVSAFFIFAIWMALRTYKKQVTTGKEGIIGEVGVAVTPIAPEGRVRIHGEYWNATSEEKIKKNEKVIVKSVNKLQLIVKKYN